MIVANFDGCCEPKNPGGAIGCGVVIKQDGNIVNQITWFKSADKNNSNNIAEYQAFILCLQDLLERDLQTAEIVIKGDSALVINQMNGSWRVKEGLYVSYAIRAQKLLKNFTNLTLVWVPREQNEEADVLSKRELITRNIHITKRD